MDADDLLHLLLRGEGDVVEDAAAQEGVGQLLFRVGRDDDDGALLCLDRLLRLGNVELHLVQLPEEVVGELKIGLVHLVDEQHYLLVGGERLAELAELDVFCDVVHAGGAELAVVKTLDDVVDVQTVLRLGGGFHVPDDELLAQRVGDGLRQHGLARAGLALDEQRLLQRHSDVHRAHQLGRGDVVFGPAEGNRHRNTSLHKSLILFYIAAPSVSMRSGGEKILKNTQTVVAFLKLLCYNTEKNPIRRQRTMKKLTKMQQKVYDYIAQFMTKWGYPPSVREICAELNFKSPSTAHFHILNLEKKGYLEHDAGKGRAIRLKGEAQAVPAVPAAPAAPSNAVDFMEERDARENRIPIVGNVAAGSPILAQECVEDYLTFDTGSRSGEFFALRVRGESMLGVGILPDDLVVVRRQQTANNGEIVVALIGDEATVKTFKKQNGEIWLLPANPDYQPIDGRECEVLGKVVAVVRQY